MLSLLESWALASSLTTFKLAWKAAILFTCSNLTLLCINNWHLFLQHHAAIFIPISGEKTAWLGHLPPQISMESHSSVNLCPDFYLKAYLRCTEPFRKNPDGLHMASLFWVTKDSTGWSVLKTISLLWVRKVLCVDKAHMSLGSLWWAAALAAGVSQVSILQAGDWARISMPDRHYFFHLHYSYRLVPGFCTVYCAGPHWVGTS